MTDHPDYARITRTEYESFQLLPEDSALTYDFIQLHAEKLMELNGLKASQLKVSFSYYEYNPCELDFEYERRETDEEYSKRVEYQEKEKQKKAARRFTQEERERKQLAALKAKYEGTDA